MDKTLLKITSLYKESARNYWKTKSYSERLEALEQIRQIIFGYDPSTERLQRTLTITKLKED